MLFENNKLGFEKASSGVTLSAQSRASDEIKRNGRLSKIHEKFSCGSQGYLGFFFGKSQSAWHFGIKSAKTLIEAKNA